MRPWLVIIAGALSLLLSIAVTWAWIVNLSNGADGFPVVPPWFGQRAHVLVIADRFTLRLCIIKLVGPFELTNSEAAQLMRPDPVAVQRLLGFEWLCRKGTQINGVTRSASLGGGWWEFQVGVPLVLVVPLLLAPLLPARRAILRGMRTARGQCPVCGYDLRATPDRCPECGTEVKRSAAR